MQIVNDFSYSDLIIVRNLDFLSSCEHSNAPTVGIGHMGYIPRDILLGVGTICRIVDELAKSANLQERLTAQIATAINDEADARCVIVVLECRHYCSKIDRSRQFATLMRSSFTVGEVSAELRREFLACCGS
jgi:GTP cyclohydrolase I